MIATSAIQGLFAKHPVPLDRPALRCLRFHSTQELLDLAGSLERIIEIPGVTAMGFSFPAEKGLVFQVSGHAVRTAMESYAVRQNTEYIAALADACQAASIELHGRLEETMDGHIVVHAFAKNPDFEVPIAIGATEELRINLGFTAQNSYGLPSVSTSLQGWACGESGTVYALPKILGRQSVTHRNLADFDASEFCVDLVTKTRKLAAVIDDAQGYALTRRDRHFLLRALGFSRRRIIQVSQAAPILSRFYDPNALTAWALYDVISAFWSKYQGALSTRLTGAAKAEQLLNTSNIPELIRRGEQLVALDDATSDSDD